MALCDAHLHLTRPDLPKLDRWRCNGLDGATSATARQDEWPEALELAKLAPTWVRFAFGIHPWYLDETSESALKELDMILFQNPRTAVGEIGLDFADGRNDRERQLQWFEAQLTLAARHRRPAVLHLRRAWECALAILAKFPDVVLIFHSFNGSREIARQLLEMLPKSYFSFGFALANPLATRQAGSAQVIPIEQLMIDSDYPFQHLPGTASSNPTDLTKVLARLAELRHEPPALLAEQLRQNWQTAFQTI